MAACKKTKDRLTRWESTWAVDCVPCSIIGRLDFNTYSVWFSDKGEKLAETKGFLLWRDRTVSFQTQARLQSMPAFAFPGKSPKRDDKRAGYVLRFA